MKYWNFFRGLHKFILILFVLQNFCVSRETLIKKNGDFRKGFYICFYKNFSEFIYFFYRKKIILIWDFSKNLFSKFLRYL